MEFGRDEGVGILWTVVVVSVTWALLYAFGMENANPGLLVGPTIYGLLLLFKGK